MPVRLTSGSRSSPSQCRRHIASVGLRAMHPDAVALHGVDLAVVGEKAERLRHRPGRQRVGAVALVEEGDRAGEALVLEIGVKRRQIFRQTKSLVDDGPRGTGDDKEIADPGGEQRSLGGRRASIRSRSNDRRPVPSGLRMKSCAISGCVSGGDVAEHRRVDRRFAPTERLQAPFSANAPRVRSRAPSACSASRPAEGPSRWRNRRAEFAARDGEISANSAGGICVRIPAPSPVRASAPTPPRWVRLTRPPSARSRCRARGGP